MMREHFVLFAEVNSIYEARFLQPLWQKYSTHEDDDWKALAIFLEGYAFARQGAPANFGHAACDAIQESRNAGLLLTDVNAAQEIWGRFFAILKANNLNYAVNPLCPGGISYQRSYKGKTITATTHNMSVVEFLSALAKENVTPEAVSQGMWYFGSQIAGSEYRVSKALDDLDYAKTLVNEHTEALGQAASSWERK